MKTIRSNDFDKKNKNFFYREGEPLTTLYVTDTGQTPDRESPAETLDNTSPRIALALKEYGIPDTILKLGTQTPEEIAFVIVTSLKSLENTRGASIEASETNPKVIAFNCAPRGGDSVEDAKGESLIYFEVNGDHFIGYGKEVAAYILALLGKKTSQSVVEVLKYAKREDTRRGSQFRSLENLIPVQADLARFSDRALAEIGKNSLVDLWPADIQEYAYFKSEEFLNNHVVLSREKWDAIPQGQIFSLFVGEKEYFIKKIGSISEIAEGELGLWEASSKIDESYVVLDLAYKRNVTKNDENRVKSIDLAQALNAEFNPSESLEGPLKLVG
jgi:hypothetical protein